MYKIIKNGDELIFVKENGVVAKIKKDAFNSQIFNLEMGNLEVCEPDVNFLKIIELAKKNGFQHLSLSIPVDSISIIHKATTVGFLLVDTLVTYKFDFKKIKLNPMQHLVQIRNAVRNDIQMLSEIAYESFTIDRFHSDPNLDSEKANNYYAKWVENSINGYAEETLVAILDDEPVGFTTVGRVVVEDGVRVGRLVLSAVSPKARGKKAYTSMIYEGLKHNLGKVDELFVGTQVNNYPVQKTWINLGGYMVDSKHVFHLLIY